MLRRHCLSKSGWEQDIVPSKWLLVLPLRGYASEQVKIIILSETWNINVVKKERCKNSPFGPGNVGHIIRIGHFLNRSMWNDSWDIYICFLEKYLIIIFQVLLKLVALKLCLKINSPRFYLWDPSRD